MVDFEGRRYSAVLVRLGEERGRIIVEVLLESSECRVILFLSQCQRRRNDDQTSTHVRRVWIEVVQLRSVGVTRRLRESEELVWLRSRGKV